LVTVVWGGCQLSLEGNADGISARWRAIKLVNHPGLPGKQNKEMLAVVDNVMELRCVRLATAAIVAAPSSMQVLDDVWAALAGPCFRRIHRCSPVGLHRIGWD